MSNTTRTDADRTKAALKAAIEADLLVAYHAAKATKNWDRAYYSVGLMTDMMRQTGGLHDFAYESKRKQRELVRNVMEALVRSGDAVRVDGIEDGKAVLQYASE